MGQRLKFRDKTKHIVYLNLERESLPRESVVVRRLLKAESLYTYYMAWAYKASSVRDYGH